MSLPPSDPLRSALIANSSRLSPPRTRWISAVIHSGGLVLWVLLFAFAFGRGGLAAWSVGAAYIVYDTAVLIFVACNAWPLMRARPAGRPAPSHGDRVTVAVILAARNEAAVLPVTLEALFEQTDPAARIVIADDGSNDATADLMRDRYGIVAAELGTLSAPSPMHPSLHWLRLAQGGKAAALNAAIVQIESAVGLTVDANTLLERHAIAAVRQAFAAEPELAGITGVIAPLCRRTVQGRIFEWFQTYEYIRNFLSRYAWMQVDSRLLISGAFAGFRRHSANPVLVPSRGRRHAPRLARGRNAPRESSRHASTPLRAHRPFSCSPTSLRRVATACSARRLRSSGSRSRSTSHFMCGR